MTMTLQIHFDYGVVEKVFPKTIQGRTDAVMLLRDLAKNNNVLGYKFVNITKETKHGKAAV